MNIKKSFVSVIVLGGIFLISGLTFNGLVSISNNDLNTFWSVKKIDFNFIDSSFAEYSNSNSLTDSEKSILKGKIDNVDNIISKKYSNDSSKLIVYKKLNKLLDEKISKLENYNLDSTNSKFKFYQKEILLLDELNNLVDSKINLIMNNINSKNIEAQKLAEQKASEQKAAEQKILEEKLAQEKLAQEKAAAQRLAEQKKSYSKVTTRTKAS